jgi:apolipoprotein N-acyltransferase
MVPRLISMRAIAGAVILAEGWRRHLVALVAGAVGALALAPMDILPAMLVPMTIAVWLIDGCVAKDPKRGARGAAWLRVPIGLRKAFGAGWWWGFGYFLGGFWWLGAAFLVEAEEFAWALPLGVLGVPAFLALFPALGFALARFLWAPGASRIFALAAGLGLAEWLRGTVLTGFPWNAFGMALGDHLVPAQIASVLGLHGLTILTVLLFSAPGAMVSCSPATIVAARAGRGRDHDEFGSNRSKFMNVIDSKNLERDAQISLRTLSKLDCAGKPVSAFPHPALAPPRIAVRPLAAALLAFAALWAYGSFRLGHAEPADVPGVKLRIMQPNLPHGAKFRPENGQAFLSHYIALSAGEADARPLDDAGITALIWPESAFPFILGLEPNALVQIGAFLPPGTVLVTGAARAGLGPNGTDATLWRSGELPEFFNSIQVVDGGVITASADKVHLVPFGEYLPFQSWLAPFGIRQFVHIPGGFDPGKERRLLTVPGLPKAAPLVCYEAIFPGEVVPPGTAERPGLLLNVTNDGWFGTTAGPHQHFLLARLRTIEEGLPLVRAAGTGISAIIDPYGRIRGELPLGVAGTFDGSLPQRIDAPVFARHPALAPFSAWLAVLSFALAGHMRSLRS